MKRWLLLLIPFALGLCVTEPASAQSGSLYSNTAYRYTPAGIFPASGASVQICTSSATGQPCTPTVTIYSDAGLSLPVANPLAACTVSPQVGCIDGFGNFTFYAAQGAYTYTVTGSGITSYGPTAFGLSCVAGVTCVSVSASNAFTGANTTASLNAVLTVGIAAGQYASLQAAHDALPASGGTIQVMGNATPFGPSFNTPLAITKPIYIHADNANFTAFSGAGPMISCSGVNGVTIEGSGHAGNDTGTNGTTFNVSNTTANGIAFSNCNGATLRNFNLFGPGQGVGSGKALVMTSNRVDVTDVNVKSWGSDCITHDGSVQNANVSKYDSPRASLCGGNSYVIKGINGNLVTLIRPDAGFSTGDCYNIASLGNTLIGANCSPSLAANICYHFLSGAVGNLGLNTFCDSPSTKSYQFESGANNNWMFNLADTTNATVIDNLGGSGNRYIPFNTTYFNQWTAGLFNAGDGQIAGPSYNFINETNTGCYRAGAGDFRCAVIATDFIRMLNGNGPIFNSAHAAAFGSSGVGSPDTGWSRCAAGVSCFGNGTQGSVSGEVRAAKVTINGGTSINKYYQASGAITPAATAANQCVEQTFTPAAFNGIVNAGDNLTSLSATATMAANGVFPVAGSRLVANGIAITYCNSTAGALTAPAVTITVTGTR